MKISINDVNHIASLARIDLGKSDLNVLTKQLNDILGYMEKLDKIDTRGVQPTFVAVHGANILREDIVDKSLKKSDVLNNAPQEDGNFFLVPKVI